MKKTEGGIKLISRLYTVSDGKNTIFATIFDKGITLQTKDKNDAFVFKRSDPIMIKNIARLMLKACGID